MRYAIWHSLDLCLFENAIILLKCKIISIMTIIIRNYHFWEKIVLSHFVLSCILNCHYPLLDRRVILSQINQVSQTSQVKFMILLHFFRIQTNMHSDESQNIKCHGCIFTSYFAAECQNEHFHLRFRAKLQDAKNHFGKMAVLLYYFHPEIDRSVDFSNLCGIICQWWPFKNVKKPLYVPDTFLLSTWFIPQTFPFKYNKYQLYTKWSTFWFWPLNMVIIQQYGGALRSTYLWDWTIWGLKNKSGRKVC